MKKTLLVAALVVLSLGVTGSILHAGAASKYIHEDGILAGFRCTFCKGTGFQPNTNFTCYACKGRGHSNSY